RIDLIAEIESLLVRRRTGIHLLHHQSIILLPEIGAKEDSIRGPAICTRRNYFQSQPSRLQRRVVIELLFSAHVTVEELFETAARHQLASLLKIHWSIVAILLVVLRVKITHHVVQR